MTEIHNKFTKDKGDKGTHLVLVLRELLSVPTKSINNNKSMTNLASQRIVYKSRQDVINNKKDKNDWLIFFYFFDKFVIACVFVARILWLMFKNRSFGHLCKY